MRNSEYDAHKALKDSPKMERAPRPQLEKPAGPMAFIMRVITIITLIILAFHFGMMYAGSL